MRKIRLVCFDLDDTLIRGMHSVMLLCALNGKQKEHDVIQKQEENGTLDFITADYLRAELVAGLEEVKVIKNLEKMVTPLAGIAETVTALHENSIRCIVVTAGPRQVAAAAGKLWGFDKTFGSDYEVNHGVFTGKILHHLGDSGKIACLASDSREHRIHKDECVAVGDGATDIPLFAYCGYSVAINYSDAVLGKASHYMRTDDLKDILHYIL